MKRTLCPLAVILVAACPCGGVENAPHITSFSLSEGRANLQWEGGAPPFDIESGTGLAGWGRVMQTVDYSASTPAGDGADAFFRVRGQQPVGGQHIGQLRIDEGEFGKPLARHRLKSLWDFHLPEDGSPPGIPSEFFQQLTLRLIYRQGAGLAVFTGTLGDLPGAVVTTAAKKITITWTFGEGDAQRDYTLEMDFTYNIAAARDPIHLSDPQYTLTCSYAILQPEAGYDGGLVMEETREDTASLYQIAEQETPDWLRRDPQFEVGDIGFATRYTLGVPMLQGSPAFIWKTPVLDGWGGTTVTGLVSTPLVFSDRFTQTYEPGHHNFVETFWIEPALVPGLAAEVLEELRAADVLFIVVTHPSAFPSKSPTIQLVGFDLAVRDS